MLAKRIYKKFKFVELLIIGLPIDFCRLISLMQFILIFKYCKLVVQNILKRFYRKATYCGPKEYGEISSTSYFGFNMIVFNVQ